MIKYCLHPDKLVIKHVEAHGENGKVKRYKNAIRYISARELAELYNVSLEECVIYDPRKKELYTGLKHLYVDPSYEYSIQNTLMETSERRR